MAFNTLTSRRPLHSHLGYRIGSRVARPSAEMPLTPLLRALRECSNRNQVYAAIEQNFVRLFDMPMAIAVPARDEARVAFASEEFRPTGGDMAAAALAMQSARATGRGAKRMRGAKSCFLPLIAGGGVVGALGFKAHPGRPWISAEEWPLLLAFGDHTALALLRAKLHDEAQGAATLRETKELHIALLNSIYHSFRTPLTCIIGALNTLEADTAFLTAETRQELVRAAHGGAERLNRVLGSLLDMSRLESGAFCVRLDPCDVEDVIGSSLEQLGLSGDRRIETVVPRDLPFVRMDFVLIVQVLVNLLDNAVKYTPADAPITVEARALDDCIEFLVRDCGDGIPETELERAFEKFNRAGRADEGGGIGLGLAICKGFVEAHGGKIRAERRLPRGTAVRFTIPFRREKGGPIQP